MEGILCFYIFVAFLKNVSLERKILGLVEQSGTFCNCGTVETRMEAIRVMLKNSQYDVVLVQEAWWVLVPVPVLVLVLVLVKEAWWLLVLVQRRGVCGIRSSKMFCGALA